MGGGAFGKAGWTAMANVLAPLFCQTLPKDQFPSYTNGLDLTVVGVNWIKPISLPLISDTVANIIRLHKKLAVHLTSAIKLHNH